MRLSRYCNCSSGIFGCLSSLDGTFLCKTLEHSYPSATSGWLPKVPSGIYVCIRGVHTLGSGAQIETFEITGVPGHTGILFHPGNTEADSEGCVLLGDKVVDFELLDSRNTFQEFMAKLAGIDSFKLEVIDAYSSPQVPS